MIQRLPENDKDQDEQQDEHQRHRDEEEEDEDYQDKKITNNNALLMKNLPRPIY